MDSPDEIGKESAEKQIWGRKDKGMKAEQEALLRVIFSVFWGN